jgi:hypothetical protein
MDNQKRFYDRVPILLLRISPLAECSSRFSRLVEILELTKKYYPFKMQRREGRNEKAFVVFHNST